MLNIAYVLFSALVVLACNVLHAEIPKCEERILSLSENYYLNEDQMVFADKKIYVKVDDTLYETPALFSDENGYYIQTVRGKCTGKCKWYEWECGKCHFCNLLQIECGGCRQLKALVRCE